MYLALSAPSTITGSARSSDTIIATRFVCLREFTNTSSLSTSSFFTSSPVAFVLPSRPYRCIKPARRQALEMALHAVEIAARIMVRSPLAPAKRCWLFMMKRVRVIGSRSKVAMAAGKVSARGRGKVDEAGRPRRGAGVEEEG